MFIFQTQTQIQETINYWGLSFDLSVLEPFQLLMTILAFNIYYIIALSFILTIIYKISLKLGKIIWN